MINLTNKKLVKNYISWKQQFTRVVSTKLKGERTSPHKDIRYLREKIRMAEQHMKMRGIDIPEV